MIDHDPLCPMREPDPGDTVRQSSCECYLIGKARADEREKIAQAIEAECAGPGWDALGANGYPSQRGIVGAWMANAARIARGGA